MRRNYGLDLFRCLAIAVVMLGHAVMVLVRPAGYLVGGIWAYAPLLAVPSIEMLLVLSGFLIGTMMIRIFEAPGTFRSRARNFWVRRWLKTVPNYYLFLAVNVVMTLVLTGAFRFNFLYALFSQNLLGPEPVDADGHGYAVYFSEAWSLAVDEWFYLILPVLVGLYAFVLKRSTKTTFLVATCTLIAIPVVARFLHGAPPDMLVWDRDIRRVTLYHLDATGWGVMAAVANRWMPRLWSWRPRFTALAGIALLWLGMQTYLELPLAANVPSSAFLPTILTHFPRLASTAGITLMALGISLTLPLVAGATTSSNGLTRVAGFGSRYSYSIYLCQLPVMAVLQAFIPPTAPAGVVVLEVALCFALTIAVAVMVFHAYERPVTAIRDRFSRRVDANPFQGRPQPQGTAAATFAQPAVRPPTFAEFIGKNS